MADEAVLDSPELEVSEEVGGEPEEIEESAEPVEGEAEPEESEELAEEEPEEEVEGEQEVSADGRKMPDGIKKGIAALKATMPEVAKEIKGLFFSNQEYRNVFAKPADAVAAKTLIEEVGGQEGIQAIHAEREEWNQIDRDYAEGKKEFVSSLAEGNPEAFLKAAPHVLNEWSSRAPDQYGYYANSVAYNTVLREPGVEAGLQTLATLHSQLADAPWAQQAIANVVNGIVGLKEKAAQFEQKSKSVDPEREKLNQDKTLFETERRASFESGVADKAEKYLEEKMQPELTRVIAGRKVDPEAMKGYQKMVQTEVMRMLGEVPGFSTNLEAHYRTGDSAKSISYIQAQYNKILPQAVKVIEPFLRNIGAPKTPVKVAGVKPNGVTPASPGSVVIKEMPSWDQVDQSRTTTADMIMGHAILRNGKRASGWT